MNKKTNFLIVKITLAIFAFFITFTAAAIAVSNDCFQYNELLKKEESLSASIAKLKNYAMCQEPCEAAQKEASAFWEKYGAPPIECNGNPPCCWPSAQKKDPNCNATIKALDAKKNQLCSSCVVPAEFIDDGPYGKRKEWEAIGVSLDEFIKSQEKYLNEKVTAVIDQLEPICAGANNQADKSNTTLPSSQKPAEKSNAQQNTAASQTQSGEKPSKTELKNEISSVENPGQKLSWGDSAETKEGETEEGDNQDLPGKGKIAYMFVQPNLGPIEELFLAGKIADWEKKFKEMGYEVRKLPWTTEYAKMAFGDPKMGAFDYYGHNGLDTQGGWLDKLTFKYGKKTPAIYGYDADVLKEIIFQAKFEYYSKTMSPEEAQERALKERDNLGLDIANIHACFSADDDSLMNLFVKEGGEFNGNVGTYYAIGDVNTNKIKD